MFRESMRAMLRRRRGGGRRGKLHRHTWVHGLPFKMRFHKSRLYVSALLPFTVGLFVGLPGDIDGMVHLSDISWEKSGEEALEEFTKGDMVKVKILEVDTEKERISLGIKQLTDDPLAGSLGSVRKGDIVTSTVSEVNDGGIES